MILRVAFLGPSGTYAEEATLALLGSKCERLAHPSIQGTLRAAAAGEVDCAVVPVENAVEGTVSATLDTLWLYPQLRVRRALVLPVRHCLIGPVQHPADIQAVYSHPQALAQCQGWLEEHLGAVERIPTASTSEALRHIGAHTAAIASERAARLHGLSVIFRAINDHPDNCTRFWLVSEKPLTETLPPPGGCTSIAFALRRNQPGVLHEVLSIFARYSINLAKIESRPTKKVLGEYLFFADLEGGAEAEPVNTALRQVAAVVAELNILGSYVIEQCGG
ncbi:prephenate dehydratase [Gloeobacter morelensis]|uniref:Prephenate dehydratase n=1 Tax=Gloeobacter morelensis MG652769 TaxID=2781736 RepID=A0ABY3PGL8_9CYAN|nr:prephenate dehydratase [Gloeobacter morelensis]UFP92812.1 prephenate dehydratase [Gloeobacter morelensis MG652769]